MKDSRQHGFRKDIRLFLLQKRKKKVMVQQNKNTESRTAATQITVFIHEHISESVLFLGG